MRTAAFIQLLAIVTFLTGCTSTPLAEAKGILIRGKVLSGDKPVQGVILLLHGTGAELPPRAVVQAYGDFEIPAEGGVPEGTFAVTVESSAGSDENGQATNTIADEYRRKESTPLNMTVKRSADGSCDVGTLVIKKRGTSR
jgi:hypothetical protein